MFCLMFIYCVSGISSVKGGGESFNAGKGEGEALRGGISGDISSGKQKARSPYLSKT